MITRVARVSERVVPERPEGEEERLGSPVGGPGECED
jgi:hypothetical protein